MPSTLGLSTIKLESPAYYCTSYTPPCSEPGLISSGQYPTLSLPRSQSPHSGLTDTSVIRVKRMRRMSSEGEETELRSAGEGKVGDLYYSQSPPPSCSSEVAIVVEATIKPLKRCLHIKGRFRRG